MSEGIKIIARNRKARHDYEILETLEAGLVLMGSEIKSIRLGRANITEGYVQQRQGEMWLLNVHIAEYEQANRWGHEPLRPRKLLMHKREIIQFQRRVQEKRLTIIPLQMYLKHGRAKVEIALVRSKRRYDKRQSLKQDDARRQIDRAMRERY